MRAFVILNKKAGSVSSAALEEEIREVFAAHKVEADVRLAEGTSIVDLVDEALSSDTDVVVSAGGDGTLKTIAEKLLGKDKPLGIIPLGTINHLARNLGIPLDVKGAIGAIAEGAVEVIDVGEVNGELFTNNAIIGILTYAMYASEHARQNGWGNKIVRGLKLVQMLIRLFFKLPLEYFEVKSGDTVIHEKAAFIMVTNNRFSFNMLNFGDRNGFNSGKLTVYFPRTSGKRELLKLLILVFMNKLDEAKDLDVFDRQSVTVRMKRERVMVAVDGEFLPLKTPLEFKSSPSVLSVYVPQEVKAGS